MSPKLLALVLSLATAIPGVTVAATIYATGVTTFAGAGVTGGRADGRRALGAEDGRFLSLGLGGAAVFSFPEAFTGPVSIIEVTDGKRAGYLETVRVFVGNVFAKGTKTFRQSDFAEIGTITNELASGTLSFVGSYRYLALLDTSPRRPGRDGFDVDSISVSTAPPAATLAPVPLPAGGLLLAMSLGALGAMRVARRRA